MRGRSQGQQPPPRVLPPHTGRVEQKKIWSIDGAESRYFQLRILWRGAVLRIVSSGSMVTAAYRFRGRKRELELAKQWKTPSLPSFCWFVAAQYTPDSWPPRSGRSR